MAVDEAIAQVPVAWRRQLLVTSDTAGASHEFIGWLAELNQAAGAVVEYSIGWDIDASVRTASRGHRRWMR